MVLDPHKLLGASGETRQGSVYRVPTEESSIVIIPYWNSFDDFSCYKLHQRLARHSLAKGQASKPETMVALSQLYVESSVVVLARDPMQLDPIVFSKDAERYGLGTSYLERLLECELYCNGDENFMTKLVRNYKTHEAILRLPSELFYGGELIPSKGESSSTGWEDVPNKSFLFYLWAFKAVMKGREVAHHGLIESKLARRWS